MPHVTPPTLRIIGYYHLMPAVASLADRLKQGLLRLSHQPAGGPDDEAVPAFKRSLERTLAKLTPGATPTPSPFRFQLTGGKALLFLGIDALPLDPAGIVRLLNSAGVDLQAGESLDLDGGLAAWVIRPEVTLTDNNLRQADITLRTLKSGRDRDHVAAQAAESAKIRLRSRLTQLVTALQSAQTDAQGKFTGPELPVVLEATPVPAAPPPPPKVPTPPPAPPPVVQAPPHPPPPPPPAPVPTGPSIDLLAKALRKLLAAVEGSGFKGAAIGDIAHAAWGSKIPPQKVEVLIAFEGPQREMLLSAARGEGLRAAPDGEPLHLEFTDAKLGGSVSVELIQATSTFRKQVLNRAQPGNVFQTGARLATCDDLILMRAGFSQPGHRESVIDLLRVAAGRLDAAYLKKEAESAGVFEQLKAAWKEAKAQV